MNYLFSILFSIFLILNSFGQIYPGYTFPNGNKIYSDNGSYYLIFQNDGNLVWYKSNGKALWSSNTNGRGVNAVFQNDGNLVVYGSGNNPIWNSKTSNIGSVLNLQNDGNLCIYTSSNSACWCSNTSTGSSQNPSQSIISLGYTFSKGNKIYSENGLYYLVFQRDGNLVLYDSDNNSMWNTQTQNRGARAIFQRDGNLVVYNSSNQAIWNSGTSNKSAIKLTIQNDGNLVIYNNSNKPLWNSGTSN